MAESLECIYKPWCNLNGFSLAELFSFSSKVNIVFIGVSSISFCESLIDLVNRPLFMVIENVPYSIVSVMGSSMIFS